VAAETDLVDEASGVEDCDDTQAVASLCEDTDCQLVRFDNIAATVESEAAESVGVTAGCEAQNGGHCNQLLDSVYSPSDDVTEDRHVTECNAVVDEDDRLAAAATSADARLPDSGLFAADVGVQVPDDEVANNMAARIVDVHDEVAAAAEVPNELQQQAAAAEGEVAEPVGNIIPPPLAVLAPQGLGDVHQAMMQGGGPVGFQPYKHPNLFALRVNVSLCLLNVVMIIIGNITDGCRMKSLFVSWSVGWHFTQHMLQDVEEITVHIVSTYTVLSKR